MFLYCDIRYPRWEWCFFPSVECRTWHHTIYYHLKHFSAFRAMQTNKQTKKISRCISERYGFGEKQKLEPLQNRSHHVSTAELFWHLFMRCANFKEMSKHHYYNHFNCKNTGSKPLLVTPKRSQGTFLPTIFPLLVPLRSSVWKVNKCLSPSTRRQDFHPPQR